MGDDRRPLKFKSCGEDDFQLYLVAAPTGKFTLLGEPDKWISVSPQRFSDLRADDAITSSVQVHGQEGETVTVRWADVQGKIVTTSCKFSAEGTLVSKITASGASCSPSAAVSDMM